LIGTGPHAYHPPPARVKLHEVLGRFVAKFPHPTVQLVTMVTPPPETIEVDSETVSCEGVGGALGHPLVYLNVGPTGVTECPYCDRRFVLRLGAPAGAGH
jgi:uncharacterized Zn-finger protein